MVEMVFAVRSLVVVALFAVVALAGPTAPAAAASGCATDTTTINIGTGELMINTPELEGVNHVDIPYPSCSAGRFYFDSGTSPAVRYHNFCAFGYLRVYADAGTVNVPAKVVWLDGSTCGSDPEAPPGHGLGHGTLDAVKLVRELLG